MSTTTQTTPGRTPLNWERIWTVVQKELNLVLRNRMTQFTIGITIGVFILLPVAMAYGMGQNGFLSRLDNGRPIDEQQISVVRQAFPQLANLPALDLLQALLLSSIQVMFLIIPLMVPM